MALIYLYNLSKFLLKGILLACIITFNYSQLFATVPDYPIGLDNLTQFQDLPNIPTGVKVLQRSSFDRTGGDHDYGNYLYSENSGYIIFDEYGPGAVARLWMTWYPTNSFDTYGRIQIYVDSDTAVLNLQIHQCFDGTTAPFLYPLVANFTTSHGGYISYVPIPFNNHCKIWINDTSMFVYYQVTFYKYDPSIQITPFNPAMDVSTVQNLWNNVGTDPKSTYGNITISNSVTVSANSTLTLLNQADSGYLTSIRFLFQNGIPTESVLTSLRLQIYWDNSTIASVDAPLGPFFGTAVDTTPIRSLFLGQDTQGRYYCYYPMPFWSNAKILLQNPLNSSPGNASYEIIYSQQTTYNQQKAGYFHAAYHREDPTTPGVDYLILDSYGTGKLLGAVMDISNSANDGLAGEMEGDERVFLDDSRSPAIHGTGTEDYFNGGWYFTVNNEIVPFNLPANGLQNFEIEYLPPLPDTVSNYASRMDRKKFYASGMERSGFPDASLFLPLTTSTSTTWWRFGAYRLQFPDAPIYHTHIRFSLEHGFQDDDIPGVYASVVYYYQMDDYTLEMTDVVEMGDFSSESEHSYSGRNTGSTGIEKYSFEGDPLEVSDPIYVFDEGRETLGSSEFYVTINPNNQGVILRRRSDQGMEKQGAMLFVNDSEVGYWYSALTNSYARWLEDEYFIPAEYTSGETTLKITLENDSSDINWTEYRYKVFSVVDPFSQDTQPPTPPDWLSGLSTATGNTLMWKEAEDNIAVTDYLIYRSYNPFTSPNNIELVGETTDFIFYDPYPPKSGEYYQIVAVDENGNQSIPSDWLLIGIPQPTAIPAKVFLKFE